VSPTDPIDFGTPSAIWRGPDLYIADLGANKTVFRRLRELGYTLEDRRPPGPVATNPPNCQRRSLAGLQQWYAALDLDRVKCGGDDVSGCGAYISRRGVRSHGHQCEMCGRTTYRTIISGTVIQFRFRDDGRSSIRPRLMRLRVVYYDHDEGHLYLDPSHIAGPTSAFDTEDQAYQYMERHQELWEYVSSPLGGFHLRVAYRYNYGPGAHPHSDIVEVATVGHYQNYREVRVWEGRELGPDEEPSSPARFGINEAWRWILPGSPDTAADRLQRGLEFVAEFAAGVEARPAVRT